MLSMTGYGSGESRRSGKQVNIVASSINRKQVDFRVSLPRELMFLEPDIRDVLKSRINRGAVNVLVDFTDEGGTPTETQLNLPLARSCWQNLMTLQEELKIAEPPTLKDLLAVPDIFTLGAPPLPEEELRAMTMEALTETMTGLMKTREVEGKALQQDLIARRKTLKDVLAGILELAPRVPVAYREKLEQRLQEFKADVPFEEERLLKEVMLFADRADITEETTRLASHLDQMLTLFDADGVIGRKLDFLIQEMVREINTIGSKCSDQDIAIAVVDFKTELERIREQAQNIE